MENMIKLLSILLLICCSVNCAKSECIGQTKLYEEFSCKPIFEKDQDCPSHYECPDFKQLDEEKCHFLNETYEPGATLESNKTSPYCAAACRCRAKSDYSVAKFDCANIECPELFNRDDDCIYPVEENKCCSSKPICGEEKNTLAKCYLDDREYLEGESMYPEKESCYTCKCTKGFDNSTIIGNDNCKVVDCGIPFRYVSRLQKGCVPMYYKTPKCCPIDWVCPSDEDKVLEIRKSDSTTSEHKCKFGKLDISIGDELQRDDKDINCSCVSPPFVQCVKAK